MGLGDDLQKEFYKLTKNGDYGEVELFTKLQDSFIELSGKTKTYNISLIHGSRSFVNFEPFKASPIWVTGIAGIKICELSDMLFVIYDTKKVHCRIFFMQNKNDDRALNNKFKANLIQLDLLKNKRRFTDANGNTSNILVNADVGTIATYGVFHKDKIYYNMKCYSADLLEPVTASGASENRVVQFTGTVGKIRKSRSKNHEDYEGLAGLKEFGTAIENLKIGEPIGRSAIIKLMKTFQEIPAELLLLDLADEQVDNLEEMYRFGQVGTVCFIKVNCEKNEDKENET